MITLPAGREVIGDKDSYPSLFRRLRPASHPLKGRLRAKTRPDHVAVNDFERKHLSRQGFAAFSRVRSARKTVIHWLRERLLSAYLRRIKIVNLDRQAKSKSNCSPCEQLVQAQSRLYAYAVTLLADLEAAHDVLQDANRVLLEKLDDYDPSRDFTQWACGFVRTQARAYFRDHARDRLQFSADLIEQIAVEAKIEVTESAYRGILRTCLDKLTDHQRMLIELRYTSESNVAGMATELGRPAASISTSLNKIRKMLIECTTRLLHVEGLA